MKNIRFNFFPEMHKEGVKFIVISGVVGLIFFFIGHIWSFLLTLIVTGFIYFFFRDPNRVIPLNEDYIISPADGVIVSISESECPDEIELQEKMKKVSIFLSPLNVHVNRIPVSGKIIKSIYHAGKFFNAFEDKASKHNERHSILLESESGKHVLCVQIAGFIARRIVCYPHVGDLMKAGHRYGIIRFGSRVDLYFPLSATVLVGVNQQVVGGETAIASFNQSTKEYAFYDESSIK